MTELLRPITDRIQRFTDHFTLDNELLEFGPAISEIKVREVENEQ